MCCYNSTVKGLGSKVLLASVLFGVAAGVFADTIYSSLNMQITFYVPCGQPDCKSGVEGGIETSLPGLDGQRIPRSLDDVLDRGVKYVTLASCPNNKFKYYALGRITFVSADSAHKNEKRTVDNVIGYVHDTGGYFKNGINPQGVHGCNKLDVAVTICQECHDKDAQKIASGNKISFIPNGQGAVDPNVYASQFPGWNLSQINHLLNPNGIPTTNSLPSQPQQYPPNQQPQQVPYPNQPGSISSSTPTQARGAAVENIIVQPKTVLRGRTLIVSWTSVNMAPNSCKVTFQNQQFADGNEGTKSFKTVSSDSSTLTFTLQCTDSQGQQTQSSDSATVQ